MIYRYIYKITCTTGSFKDHFYFGQRTTRINPLIDKYKGSGKLLGDYYKKHPNDYIKDIISYHNSQEELNKAEYDIIHPFLKNEMCLNLREGGYLEEDSKFKLRYRIPWNKGKKSSEESKKKCSESHKKLNGLYTWVYKDNKDTRIKKSELKTYLSLGYTQGRLFSPPKISHPSPHKGKICINDTVHNKYIKFEDLDYYLKLGYIVGHIGNVKHSEETKEKIRIKAKEQWERQKNNLLY